MRVGIIGTGFVGTAVFEGLRHAFDIVAYDKIKGWSYASGGQVNSPIVDFFLCYPYGNDRPTPFEHLASVSDVIFVCVPSPMRPDGSCDTSIVEDVFDELSWATKDCHRTVVLKSTVVPGTTEKLNAEYKNLSICFNPEFLRERSAVADFKNQSHIILGGPHEATSYVKQMYEAAYPGVPVTKTSSTIAEMVKYMTNTFLAVKASFANEIQQICGGLGIDYDKVVEYAIKDERLGKSHWAVPGPDGMKGWGGKCFPKDINALIQKAQQLGVDPKVMRAAWEKNLEVRPTKDWETIPGATSQN